MPVDFVYPCVQTLEEIGDVVMNEKRLQQLNTLVETVKLCIGDYEATMKSSIDFK